MNSGAAAPFRTTSLADARAAIAARFAPRLEVPRQLGGITLTEAQLTSAQRAAEVLDTWGGVLLGDATGTGKTYVALALARAHRSLLVIAPAALRATWTTALGRARRSARVVSVEGLGRAPAAALGETMVIIDEAHHLRTPTTRRFRNAAVLCRGRPVILLSATPLHNRPLELTTLLRLFLGDDAHDLTAAELGALVVRGAEAATAAPRPRVITHPPVVIRDDAAIVRGIMSLSPPVPTSDGGVAVALWRMALLRAWCSSAAALASMLRRAELTCAALQDAAAAGTSLTRRDLRAWGREDGQLAWPQLLHGHATTAFDAGALAAHRADVAALRRRVVSAGTRDRARADALRAVAARHANVPVLACAQYAATVEALWQALRTTPGVAAITATGGRIASGRVTRQAVLERFAPTAQGVPPPPDRERVTLLITTDVVSEGLNLQDAGVIVHLDTPWTPARLAQREGRLARPGSPHSTVHAYRLRTARSANAILALERRLARKRRAALTVESAAEATMHTRRTVRSWAAQRGVCPTTAPLVVGVAVPPAPVGTGGLAPRPLRERPVTLVCLGGAAPTLLASVDGSPLSDTPRVVAEAVRRVDRATEQPLPDTRTVTRTLAQLQRVLDHATARHLAMADRPHASRTAKTRLDRMRTTLAQAPPHVRTALAIANAEHLRTVATPRHARATHHRIDVVISSFERRGTTAAPRVT